MYTVESFCTSISVPQFIDSYVHIASFDSLCRQCPHYAKNWSCPPYTFNPVDLWSQYDTLDIRGVRLDFEPFATDVASNHIQHQMMVDFTHERDILDSTLMQQEQEIPGCRALFAGRCTACEGTCTRMLGQPCVHPELMHYSIESLGGDIVSLLKELLGITLEWSNDIYAPQHLVAVGALLRTDSAK